MQHTIIQQTFDEERALYALSDADVTACVFDGAADGESALKECHNLHIHNCRFALRYPLWHTDHFTLSDSRLEPTARAPIWYASNGNVRHCQIDGVKCLRECTDFVIENTRIQSPEFGWKCRRLHLRHSSVDSEYLLLESRDVELSHVTMSGKYSFQYVENLTADDCNFQTKDAFWHAKNVTVRHSTVCGEYLGWYSDGLTLIDCHIVGTQPLCYCKNLTLINCTMENTDLAFEYSDVQAEINGRILSVKNPHRGKICADEIGEIIQENSVMENECQITVRSRSHV